jgi:hypothetical protein
MDITPVRVGAFQTHAQAHAARGYLNERGIDCEVVADDSHGLDPNVAFGTSRVTLLVPSDQAHDARSLLNEMESASPQGRRWVELLIGAAILTLIVALIIFAFASQ